MYTFITVPPFNISLPDPIRGAMVGSPLIIQCNVSGMGLSSIMISWIGPQGNTITSGGRVTINPTSGSGTMYTSSIEVTYLMEGDEGMYTCSVLSSGNIRSESIEIEALTGDSWYMHTC